MGRRDPDTNCFGIMTSGKLCLAGAFSGTHSFLKQICARALGSKVPWASSRDLNLKGALCRLALNAFEPKAQCLHYNSRVQPADDIQHIAANIFFVRKKPCFCSHFAVETEQYLASYMKTPKPTNKFIAIWSCLIFLSGSLSAEAVARLFAAETEAQSFDVKLSGKACRSTGVPNSPSSKDATLQTDLQPSH